MNPPKNTSSEHVVYKYCFECQNKNKIFDHNMFETCIFRGNSINNLLSYCGLTDARIRASEKDLPVTQSKMVSPGFCSVKYFMSPFRYSIINCFAASRGSRPGNDRYQLNAGSVVYSLVQNEHRPYAY